MVCLLCDFKILLTVFNQSYNCQTSHYLGRNWLPKPFLILPSLKEMNSLNLDIHHAHHDSISTSITSEEITVYKVEKTCPFCSNWCTVVPRSYAIFAATLFWIGSKQNRDKLFSPFSIQLHYFLTPSNTISSFFPPSPTLQIYTTRIRWNSSHSS